MLKKTVIITILLLATTIIILSSAGGSENISQELPETTPEKEQSNIIRIAMTQEIPGYFTLNGENFGYQYELISEFARSLGKDIEITSGNHASEYDQLISSGEVDMAAALGYNIAYDIDRAVPVYRTSYVVLTGKKNARNIKNLDEISIYELFDNRKLLISQGFSSSKMYDEMLDSLRSTEAYISPCNSFDLISSLSSGKFDYLICEESEANLGCALVKNITQIIRFDEDIPVYMLFAKGSQLAKYFSAWLGEFRQSDRHIALSNRYFNKGIANHIIMGGINNRSNGGISAYDDTLKRICSEESMDWRLVSAIAYNESKFNPYIVSPRGAKGLMQVMPAVARQFNFTEDSLMDPETNITVAIKVLKKIESMIKFSEGTGFSDRMSIILASYNGGVGHVMDARNLARKYGENPDSWSDVKKYLELKSEDEYALDDVVKNGHFRGSKETTNFVANVMSRYDSYCMRVAK